MEEKTKQDKRSWFVIIGIFLVILAIVLFIFFLLRGETRINSDAQIKISESLSCQAANLSYPIYSSDKAINSTTKINAIFKNDQLDTISLVRKMTYSDAETAKIYSDGHEGDMNTDYGKKGLNPYDLNATFSHKETVAQMTLYASSKEINNKTIIYFMLDDLPSNMEEYETGYTNKGFTCEIVKESNNN